MKTIIFCLLLLVGSQVSAQIDLHIGDFIYKRTGDGVYKGNRAIIGSFDFEAPPEPLKPVKINFNLEVTPAYIFPPGDREIILRWGPKAVRVVGDSVFFWPGPHKIGDTYSGVIEVIPLTSGYQGFSLGLIDSQTPGLMPLSESENRYTFHSGSNSHALEVRWCFDNDGKLLALGKKDWHGPGIHLIEPVASYKKSGSQCTFFTPDSVHMIQRYSGPSDVFKYDISIIPPFQIGDTSTVTYHLTALDDLPNELEIEMYVSGMKVVSIPQRLDKGFTKGERVDYQIKVVPIPINQQHVIRVNLRDLTPGYTERNTFAARIVAIYKGDGRLRAICDENALYYNEQLKADIFRDKQPG